MFKDLKLRDRILVGYFIPTVLILAFSGVVYFTARQSLKTLKQVELSNDAIEGTDEMVVSFGNMDRRIRRYLLVQNDEALDKYEQDKKRFEVGAELANQAIHDLGQKELLEKMVRLEKEFDQLKDKTIELENLGNHKLAVESYVTESVEFAQQFEDTNAQFNNREKEILDQSTDLTQASVELLRVAAVLASVLTLAVGIIATHLISQLLGNRIFKVVTAAELISNGDLTESVEMATGSDEIGQLFQSFRKMIQNLNMLIRQVQQSGVQVTTSATQISASGKQLETTMNEQVAATSQVVATAKEIAVTAEELVQTMEGVMQMAQTTTLAADAGQRDLNRMEATIRQLTTATGSIAAKLEAISEKTNKISSVIVTITKVSDQTNLLSLNAAIEAEKAGEYGLGFAVVAREIRRLADQTAVATLDIETMIQEMQSAVSTGVMEMDKFTQEVAQTIGDVRNIGSQLGQIIEQVQSLAPQFSVVNQGMEAQSQGAQQISQAMLLLSETSHQTAGSLRETNQAIAQLTDAAQSLRREISGFKVAG